MTLHFDRISTEHTKLVSKMEGLNVGDISWWFKFRQKCETSVSSRNKQGLAAHGTMRHDADISPSPNEVLDSGY